MASDGIWSKVSTSSVEAVILALSLMISLCVSRLVKALSTVSISSESFFAIQAGEELNCSVFVSDRIAKCSQDNSLSKASCSIFLMLICQVRTSHRWL